VIYGLRRLPPRWPWIAGMVTAGALLLAALPFKDDKFLAAWFLLATLPTSVLVTIHPSVSSAALPDALLKHGILANIPLFGLFFGLAFQRNWFLKTVGVIAFLVVFLWALSILWALPGLRIG